MAEHDAAVAAARERVAGSDRPLSELPGSFAATRGTLHAVAEEQLKPKRVLETGNEIALRFTPDGFGTPPWENGAVSGRPGQMRVEGTELILVEGDDETRTELDVDSASASALADWFAFGTVVLADLLDRHDGLDPEPIRLWPEHFDVATVVGDEAAGTRANVGASPGDGDHPEPYLYVGPWEQSVSDDVWNATAFVGAELLLADLLEAPDQLAAAAEFLDRCVAALASA